MTNPSRNIRTKRWGESQFLMTVFREKLLGDSLSAQIRHSSSIKTKRMCLGAFEKNVETRDRDRDRDRQSRLDGFQMKTSLEGGYRCSVSRSRRTGSRRLSE